MAQTQPFTPQEQLDPLSQLFANILPPEQPGRPTPLQPGVMSPPSPLQIPPAQTTPPQAMPGQPPVASAPPPASDDPAIAMPKLPQPPNPNNSPVSEWLKELAADRAGRNAVPPVDYQGTKPHWYDRLLGFGIGTLAGYGNPQEGERTAENVAFRKRHGAEAQYQNAVHPWDERLQIDQRMLPSVEAASRIPQQSFDNQMKVAEEGRQQAEAGERMGKWRSQTNKYNENFIEGTQKDDASSPTGKVAMTVAGDWKPWSPKQGGAGGTPHTVETGSGVFQFNDKTGRYDIKVGPPKKEPDGEKPATKGQFAGVENRKAQAMAAAEKEYQRKVFKLDPAAPESEPVRQGAQDALEQAKQQAQNAYENEIAALGGTAQHTELDRPQLGGAKPQVKSITQAGLQAAAQAHFGGDIEKAKAQFLKDNPGATIQ